MVAQERANTKVAASSIRRWTIALKNACNNAANFLHALITIPNGNHTPRYSYSRLLRKKRYDRLGGIKGRKKGVLLARDNIIDRLVRERKRGGGGRRREERREEKKIGTLMTKRMARLGAGKGGGGGYAERKESKV